ncbi:Dps family protein [Prolixibacter denitrificans]|uniref:DNA starvation/stationary phase protection protein n=2 Tax=Prolixibacter denitrificans TaxID=1541063 RepID=A0ABQ0ZHY0_9BACT|nr:Dps family protein [Prolixibacter denitrificans]GET21051.1 DNA starvation/stationary phase protection protein [Prolixibacter denitrificans]
MNMNLNAIGLDVEKAENLSAKLNQLLANYQVFYINVRGFHWNIKGDKFFELHIKFEELYNDLQLKNDEIAERILTLGNTPFHSYTDFLKNSTVKEVTDISDGNQCVAEILNAFKVIIELQREILADSDEASDEGTNALMSDYIREQEKLVWMYSSFLGDKILN